jgi:hypothetical protein
VSFSLTSQEDAQHLIRMLRALKATDEDVSE